MIAVDNNYYKYTKHHQVNILSLHKQNLRKQKTGNADRTSQVVFELNAE